MRGKQDQRSSQAPARTRTGQRQNSSPVIPIVAGLVVLAIIVAAIISLENQASRTSAKPGDVSTPSSTSQAQPTTSIPYPNVPRISVQEAQDKLGQGQAVLIDVRSKPSYDKAHAQGALSIPEEEIDGHLNELPRDKELILYCT